jgi:phosphatidylglycerophosphate synthase
MPNHLTILGIIHTAFSIIALLAAFYALYRFGKLDPKTGPGRWYIILTIITCLTSLPIMKTGHPTAGHYVAVIILILIPLGVYVRSLRIFGKLADYVQVIFLSTTLFLSCIPAIVETLTRVPISQPIASGPNDPIIQNGLSALALLYLVGVIYQLFKLRKQRKAGQPLTSAAN